jgi:hypothetical protein
MELAVSHTHPSGGFLGIELLMQGTPLREAIELVANMPRLLAQRVLEVQHGPLWAVYDAERDLHLPDSGHTLMA